MKIKELKNKNPKELQTLLGEKSLALRTFRFAVAGSNVRNVKEGKFLKKDIARIQTLLSLNGPKRSVGNKSNKAQATTVKK